MTPNPRRHGRYIHPHEAVLPEDSIIQSGYIEILPREEEMSPEEIKRVTTAIQTRQPLVFMDEERGDLFP